MRNEAIPPWPPWPPKPPAPAPGPGSGVGIVERVAEALKTAPLLTMRLLPTRMRAGREPVMVMIWFVGMMRSPLMAKTAMPLSR